MKRPQNELPYLELIIMALALLGIAVVLRII